MDGGGHESREIGGCDGKRGARGRGCAGAGRPVYGWSWHGDTSSTSRAWGRGCRVLAEGFVAAVRGPDSGGVMAHFGPLAWPPMAVKGVYRETRLWVEADILGHSAREERQFRGTSARSCEHFGGRAGSGQDDAPVAKAGHLFESSEVEGNLLYRRISRQPTEKS